jgi:HEAT repeat protein
MEIKSETEAVQILDDSFRESLDREEAVRFLAQTHNEKAIERLVQALQDDDFGVRWEASVVLARLGNKALPNLLKALMDPKLVGDPRLRRGAFRVLHHMPSASRPHSVGKLMKALRSPAADLVSMEEAYVVFRELKAGRIRNN